MEHKHVKCLANEAQHHRLGSLSLTALYYHSTFCLSMAISVYLSVCAQLFSHSLVPTNHW